MDWSRIAVIGLSAYILYLGVKCPCENIMSCSLQQFGGAAILLAGIIAYRNSI